MSHALFIGGIMLGLLFANISGYHWVVVVVAACVIIAALFIRRMNKRKEHKALFIITDKRKDRIALAETLILYSLFLGYSLYIMPASDRPYFWALFFAYLIAVPVSESYRTIYLLNSNSLHYKHSKIRFDQIMEIREDPEHLIIDTHQYLNHLKIRKSILSEESRAFLESKAPGGDVNQNSSSGSR